MGILYNRKELNERRKQLRADMTEAERILWQVLKGRKLCNEKFRRQYSINAYVVDFYCTALKLAIEIDGATHSTIEEIKYDKIRQNEIEVAGIVFLRFTNSQIYKNLPNVLEMIKNTIEELRANNFSNINHGERDKFLKPPPY